MTSLPFQSTRLQEARPPSWPSYEPYTISIHAPARGATSLLQKRSSPLQFQSTRLQEARLTSVKTHGLDAISIHAPARGATCRFGHLAHIFAFQSTRLQEARRPLHREYQRGLNFNPRACKRRDFFIQLPPPLSSISIHAPARGATLKHRIFCRLRHFNPRACKRRDMIPVLALRAA